MTGSIPAAVAFAQSGTADVSSILSNLAVVLFFVLLGGVFAAAEISLVSLRASQIERLSAADSKRARRLARLARDPNRFLAAVQVGVTLAGFVSAGFGAAQIAPQVAPVLEDLGLGPGVASGTAFVAVTLLIAYLSLVLGELVPKRLALQRAEGTALLLATPVDVLATITRPFIWLLGRSTNLVVRLLGADPGADRDSITREELRHLVAGHEEFTEAERDLVADVLSVGDRQLREVMVPRTEVVFLDAAMTRGEALVRIGSLPYSRYPVTDGSADDVIGFVHVRDVLRPDPADTALRDFVRPVALLPDSKRVIPALTDLRGAGQHLAIVVDEYGGTDGIVTLEDLIEELVGDIRDEYDDPTDVRPAFVDPGEVEGLLNLDDFADLTGVALPAGPYETVAGFVIAGLGALPAIGDSVTFGGCRLTVERLDGRRIDRIRVARVPTGGDAAAPDPDSAPSQ